MDQLENFYASIGKGYAFEGGCLATGAATLNGEGVAGAVV